MGTLKRKEIETLSIEKISQLTSQYEVYIFDLWGVIHDGITPFPPTLEVMHNLKQEGKSLYLLSNSPRRSNATIEHLTSMGVSKDLYDGVYTSGEDCYNRLKRRDHPFYQELGKKLFHIGPERNLGTFEGLGYTLINSPFEAEFVLVTGTEDWYETLEPYQAVLEECLMNGLPMICANQDLIIHRQGKALICAGTIAHQYEEMGGEVFYHGKPSQEMYQRLCQTYNLSTLPSQMLMIGDSLLTDIPGALEYGMDALLVESGIHVNEIQDPEKLFEKYRVRPTWRIKTCRW